MIISGGARCNAAFFAKHLMRTDENDHVRIAEIRGLASHEVRGALREMEALASGTQCKNYFYHANINPPAHERLSPQQWEQAIDVLEKNLNLQGHSRVVVEHEKLGRTHCHVIWSRINPDTMTAVSDSRNYAAHERAARELERLFGHERVQGVHVELDGSDRAPRRPENWETFRGHRSGIDPQLVKEEVTALWQHADTGLAFRAALTEAGYILCQGDRRDFVVIDQAGDEHSLARRIKGEKAAGIRARMADIDRGSLPTVDEGRARARDAADGASGWHKLSTEAQPERNVGSAAGRYSALEERLAGAFLTEPKAEITGSLAPDLAARFGDPLADLHEAAGGARDNWQQVQAGERAPWQPEAPRDAAAPQRANSWGTAWRNFADRVTRFAETISEIWAESHGAERERSWSHRLAHLAVTATRAVIHRREPQGWTQLIEEGRDALRDWTAGKSADQRSWQARAGGASMHKSEPSRTTRDPYSAMVEALSGGEEGREGEDMADTPAPKSPTPQRDGPDLG